jgi:acyl-homoserine-lactone acylase
VLEGVADELTGRPGSLEAAWGEVYRLGRDSVNVPGNGGSGSYGIFRVIEYTEPGSTGRAVAVGGDSFVALVEFGRPVRARALLGYGNASQPGSPHRTDQLALAARKQLREVWRARGEIEANLLKRERF